MMNRLIKMLGGYTREEYAALAERYNAIPEVWTAAVKALTEQKRATIIEGYAVVQNVEIDGALIIAPRSGAHIYSCISESSYFPVDSKQRIH